MPPSDPPESEFDAGYNARKLEERIARLRFACGEILCPVCKDDNADFAAVIAAAEARGRAATFDVCLQELSDRVRKIRDAVDGMYVDEDAEIGAAALSDAHAAIARLKENPDAR